MKRILFALLVTAIALPLVGCKGGGGDDYDPKNIAVKQPGNGPPPINQPMGESKPGAPKGGAGTAGTTGTTG